MTFKELRVWHWREALKASKTLDSKLGNKTSKTTARRKWAFHMGVVQMMNDLFTTTAEQDAGNG